MQEVNKNPELLLDENADWMKLILMSTMGALIGWESGGAVLFKLSNEEKYKRCRNIWRLWLITCVIYIYAFYDYSLQVFYVRLF